MLHNRPIMNQGTASSLSRPPLRQAGGTLLGFVAGLLVGLGVALAVAVYVTKVPIPLVDRGLQRKPAEDAAEAERNKTWNPNAGLGGKTAAPAATPPAAEATPTPPAAPAAAPAAPAKGDPLGALIQSKIDGPAKPAGTTAEAPAAPDPFVYFVQAGAFKAPEEAETQRAKLAMLGLDAKVTEREQAGRTMYRVRVGPYAEKADADAVQTRLGGQGFEAALVRVQK